MNYSIRLIKAEKLGILSENYPKILCSFCLSQIYCIIIRALRNNLARKNSSRDGCDGINYKL